MNKFKLIINESIPAASAGILSDVLKKYLSDRGCALSDGGFIVECKIDKAIGDGYEIKKCDNGAIIIGGGLVNVFAALGRFLLESDFDGHGGFAAAKTTIKHCEKISLRGMYFATHFYNFYHEAPLEAVYEIIDDLALHGCNALLVWFDMHHHKSIEEPEAVLMISRLKAILHHAELVGIMPSMLMISNEGFDGTPEEIRAENKLQNGYTSLMAGYYNVEICPSKPGGREELLRQRKQVLDAFSDIDLKYVCYWPYDQGGCSCVGCAPWGVNGYMKLLPEFCDTVKSVFPGAEIILSTWFFDRFTSGEWRGMYDILSRGTPSGVSKIMSNFFDSLPQEFENGVPQGVEFISFPEISMQGAEPWGGFGANPLPRFLADTDYPDIYRGGFPYSEGIFDDINKWICLRDFSGQKDTATAVAEYVKNEFCCSDKELSDAIILMEKTLPRNTCVKDGLLHCEIYDTTFVETIYETIKKYDALIPQKLRAGWKWRIIYCRAVIDYELLQNDGIPSRSEECQNRLSELFSLYSAEHALSYVRPPVGL